MLCFVQSLPSFYQFLPASWARFFGTPVRRVPTSVESQLGLGSQVQSSSQERTIRLVTRTQDLRWKKTSSPSPVFSSLHFRNSPSSGCGPRVPGRTDPLRPRHSKEHRSRRHGVFCVFVMGRPPSSTPSKRNIDQSTQSGPQGLPVRKHTH